MTISAVRIARFKQRHSDLYTRRRGFIGKRRTWSPQIITFRTWLQSQCRCLLPVSEPCGRRCRNGLLSKAMGLIVPKDGKCHPRGRHWISNRKNNPNPECFCANRDRKMDSNTGKTVDGIERLERQEKAKTSFEIWPLTFLPRNDCCADIPSQLLLANVPFENTIRDGMCDLRESEIGSSGTSVQGIISGIEKLENRRSKQYQKSRF